MLTAGWGRIINMSSVNGQKGQFGQTNCRWALGPKGS